jgi:hypothetical protein
MPLQIIDRVKRRFSLSFYISLLLVVIAIVPLLVTVSSIEIFLRPSLVSQISSAMETDAQTHVQLIDTYLAERLNDIKTLSQSDVIKNVLAGDPNSRLLASNALFTTLHRDVADYISLSLLNPQGNTVTLSYPIAPTLHGKYLIQPALLQQISTAQQILISDVFYDSLANNPSIDLYARVVDDNFHLIGIVRASMSLHRLWQPIDSTPQTEGSDSYAFVLDQHNVRIAYTNPDHSGFTHPTILFKSIGTLSEDFQNQIKDENLYGNSTIAVSSTPDKTLLQLQNTTMPSIFQFRPAGQNQVFQAARYTSAVVPWTYFVLKPLTTVTGLADQQLFGTLLIASIMILLSLVVGIQVSRRIAAPIIRSVVSLRKNSLTLKTLASEEQVVATEQSWMVEASQTAQQSINYYTNAASIAAQRISAISDELAYRSDSFDTQMLYKSLRDMAESAKYIDLAIKHQKSANDKLASALRVTNRATEQLNKGAQSTDTAATELEHIVQQLIAVIGTKEKSENKRSV